MMEITVTGVVEGYFDTSDRPVDNKTGAIEAVGDYKAVQYGIISSVTGVDLGRLSIGTEVVVGVARVGFAYAQNNLEGAKYEAGRVAAEVAGATIGTVIGSALGGVGAPVLGAFGAYIGGQAYDGNLNPSPTDPFGPTASYGLVKDGVSAALRADWSGDANNPTGFINTSTNGYIVGAYNEGFSQQQISQGIYSGSRDINGPENVFSIGGGSAPGGSTGNWGGNGDSGGSSTGATNSNNPGSSHYSGPSNSGSSSTGATNFNNPGSSFHSSPSTSGESSTSNWGGGGNSGNDNAESSNSNVGSSRDDLSGWGDDGYIPIILDLDQNGISITELSQSNVFLDSNNDGLKNRTAWAGAGDAVLFFDPDNLNAIVESRQFIFTEWDPTATGDLEALRSVFDSNDDGKFTAADDEFAKFKLMVTNADGSTSVITLIAAGIVEIDLNPDATLIDLPDGSQITGQTTYTLANGTTGTVANTTLMSDSNSYNVVQTSSTDANGIRTVITKAYGETGDLAFSVHSQTSADGSDISNLHDDDGDGVVDRIQTIETVLNGAGEEVETVNNWLGADQLTAVLSTSQVTTTSADGSIVTIERDSRGGGWNDEIEIQTTLADGSRTVEIKHLAEDGTVIAKTFDTISIDGLSRNRDIDIDGDQAADITTDRVIFIAADGERTETVDIKNADGSARTSNTTITSSDGQYRITSDDLDGDGDFDIIRTTDISVLADGSTSSTDVVTNHDGSLRNSTTTSQSEDTRTKSKTMDEDGDGIADRVSLDVTTIVNDERTETKTVSNADGSVRLMEKTVLGADKVSQEQWVDLNQNGLFEVSDVSAYGTD